ncbi:MAG: hypothetical protein OEV64_12395, partial [Desulfobulbaceae bacterium]|nr:hypothetical protein [Desulfobulbaceae bacterium]
MPATLSHIGVQTLCSKALFRDPDLKWIGLGCLIPDLPWIIQRIVPAIIPYINRYELRLYCIIQATLFFCLLLCGAMSLQVKRRGKVFALLSCNCALHLLLDALQTKWANGVHLFAPFSWKLLGFQLFWPEDLLSYLLMGGGLLIFFYYGLRQRPEKIFVSPRPKSFLLGAALLLIYVASPVFSFSGPLEADNHFVATLSDLNARTGKPIEIDRCRYNAGYETITVFNGEDIRLIHPQLPKVNATLSLKGTFHDPQTIVVTSLHIHHPGYRDIGVL